MRGDVYAASNRTQLPTDFNQLFGAVYLAGPPEGVAPASASKRYGNPENNLDSNVELSAAPAESPITATIANGSSVVASLDYSGQIDRYAVSLSAGQTLIAYTTGLTDTLGRLTDSEGIGLIEDNNAGEGNNFRISHTVEEAGTYYITVSGSRGASGNYRLSVEVIDPPEPLEIYRHITIGFDRGSLSSKSSDGSLSSRNQFSVLRIGYYSHRGKAGILGFGYKVNLGVALDGDYLSRRSDRHRYVLGDQIHLGQFFGASFKIIDKGSIRWFTAVGLSIDFILAMDVAMRIRERPDATTVTIGTELNSYFTYMFNPYFGLSLGGNFTYYFLSVSDSGAGPSGGFGIFVTFAP